ncbi:Cis-2,3-dihydrobiphenyl-2,3-diol dehydrogenase [Frankliniella fusca]|uniref:Cis-2,3-dihydrobiphenyl-2,3-diol dehydrogenase n=1 Tax=Frankliniella fusca TaxID=407009 RepID=A0AAE1LF07_9NEOP|nr:Cis-2,3-dihydrobiphenyl-2,3-diol dehydrogenase [Frankliniella fusca]
MTQHALYAESGKAVGSHFYHVGDGYYYHIHKENIATLNFRCKNSNCPGRAVFTTHFEYTITQLHNHAPDVLYSEVHSARASIINEARSMTYSSFSDIIRTAKRSIPNLMVRSQLTLRNLRSAMQRTRSDVFPQIPGTLLGLTRILEDPMWETLTRTVDFEDRIYLGTAIGADMSVNIIFMSSRGLQLLREAERVFADGTFFISPSVEGCYQVFTLLIIYGHTVIPLCWCLMQNKSQAAYEAVLLLIRNHLGIWNFSTVICDFEDAMIVAFKNIFDVEVQGCLFHASDAIARYGKEIFGLHVIHSYPESGLNAIGFACVGLGDFLYGIVRPFLAYIQISWLEHPNRGSSMSVCGSEHRTNNASESNNRQMRRKFNGVHHPNVFHFIRNVANFEHEARDDIMSLQRGLIPTRHRKVVSVANDALIIRFTNALLTDPNPSDQTLIDFLMLASTAIQGHIQDVLQ